MDKPTPVEVEATWLEVWEGALLLEAARSYPYDAGEESTAARRLATAVRETIGAERNAVDAFPGRMQRAGRNATRESFDAYMAGRRIPARDYMLTAAKVLGLPPERLWRGRGWMAGPKGRVPRYMYPALATYLLTGGRKSEILGLEIGDVSFERSAIIIRPNRWRRLKSRAARRRIPLWPQLREVLEPYVEQRRAEGAGDGDLLFPSRETGQRVDDFRKALDRIASRAGRGPGDLGPKAFRHAYCSARLQTLDGGARCRSTP